MRNLLVPILSLLLAAGSLFSLTSCGHTLYGMSLDAERLRSRVPQTGQARYQNDQYQQQAPSYQGYQQQQTPNYQGYQQQQAAPQGYGY